MAIFKILGLLLEMMSIIKSAPFGNFEGNLPVPAVSDLPDTTKSWHKNGFLLGLLSHRSPCSTHTHTPSLGQQMNCSPCTQTPSLGL